MVSGLSLMFGDGQDHFRTTGASAYHGQWAVMITPLLPALVETGYRFYRHDVRVTATHGLQVRCGAHIQA
jgi:hypothetical protein